MAKTIGQCKRRELLLALFKLAVRFDSVHEQADPLTLGWALLLFTKSSARKSSAMFYPSSPLQDISLL